jgi:hypothetical protein
MLGLGLLGVLQVDFVKKQQFPFLVLYRLNQDKLRTQQLIRFCFLFVLGSQSSAPSSAKKGFHK